MTYLDTPEDMQWLRDVHCKDMPETMTCAILEGDEDSPTKIEAWIINNPHYQAPADYVWTPNPYSVTTFDVCTPGMERLRNQDEFLLVGHVQHDTTREDLESQFIDDIQTCERPDGFNFDACRTMVREFMANVDMASALRYVEPSTDSDDENEESGCSAYLYVRDSSAE